MKIEIGDREYNVTCARTEEERIKGLQGVTEMKDDEGMLFFFEEPQTVGFWMKDTKIPLCRENPTLRYGSNISISGRT